MQTQHKPEMDGWYRDTSGRTFQVVGVDDQEATVEIQYFGGEVEDLGLSSWYAMELEAIDSPEDWTGPFDDLLRDDLGDTDSVRHPEDWNGPWEEMDRNRM